MPLDTFSAVLDSLIAPARNCFSIVPNDNAVLPFLPKAIYVGSGGTLVRSQQRCDLHQCRKRDAHPHPYSPR